MAIDINLVSREILEFGKKAYSIPVLSIRVLVNAKYIRYVKPTLHSHEDRRGFHQCLVQWMANINGFGGWCSFNVEEFVQQCTKKAVLARQVFEKVSSTFIQNQNSQPHCLRPNCSSLPKRDTHRRPSTSYSTTIR